MTDLLGGDPSLLGITAAWLTAHLEASVDNENQVGCDGTIYGNVRERIHYRHYTQFVFRAEYTLINLSYSITYPQMQAIPLHYPHSYDLKK